MPMCLSFDILASLQADRAHMIAPLHTASKILVFPMPVHKSSCGEARPFRTNATSISDPSQFLAVERKSSNRTTGRRNGGALSSALDWSLAPRTLTHQSSEEFGWVVQNFVGRAARTCLHMQSIIGRSCLQKR